ncbi:MAG: apolipoprotein N-acyltransferase, partial [Schleiferiaceae bacterium]|nr:apolipoprotein N-acyltransferase [Schleiferiaceae bacterium]
FLPLLFLEEWLSRTHPDKRGKMALWYAYPGFLLFNITTSWWIWHASDWGSVAAITITAFMQSAVFAIFSLVKKNIGARRAYIALPFLWVCLEGFQHWWALSWPWLHLGQAFATHVSWIQWYEYTGVFGGTLWVGFVNIALYLVASNFYYLHKQWKPLVGQGILVLVLLVAVPIWYSVTVYRAYEEKGTATDIVVVQPNVDSYTEKFAVPETQLTQQFLQLAQEKTDQQVDFVVGPETMLPRGFHTPEPRLNQSIELLSEWLKQYPNTELIAGASTYKIFQEGEKRSKTARKFRDADRYFDSYNTAFHIVNGREEVALYHKSKLVVGVEMMPYTWLLEPLLGRLIIDLGGTTGTLATQEQREVFSHAQKDVAVGVPICYESIYGDFVTDYIAEGATLLFVITNDGWWENTPGHRQHMHYARLRAIENRRAVARSANTGISCFINQRGDVLQALPYGVSGVLRETLYANDATTYYSKTGDYLLNISLFMAFFTVIGAFVQKKLRR